MQTPTVSTCPKCARQVSIPTGVDLSARVRCPWCRAEYAVSDAIGWTPPMLMVVEAAAGATPEPPAEASPVEPLSEEPREGEEHNEAAAVAAGVPKMSVAATLRPPRSKSVVRTLVEVVLGGLAGCLVAYYALAFWFGPEFHRVGLPQLPLPFIGRLTEPAHPPDNKPAAPNATPPDGRSAAK